jgi:hypothetical protein
VWATLFRLVPFINVNQVFSFYFYSHEECESISANGSVIAASGDNNAGSAYTEAKLLFIVDAYYY